LIWFSFPVPPQILPFDFGDEQFNSGDMTSASCSISKGDLPLTIFWIFNGRTVDNGNGVVVSLVNKRLSTLSIESVQAENAGEYSCVATNAAGEGRQSSTLRVNGIDMSHIYFKILLITFTPNLTLSSDWKQSKLLGWLNMGLASSVETLGLLRLGVFSNLILQLPHKFYILTLVKNL
jgi:hypothetical protein